MQCPAVSDHELIFASLTLSFERFEEFIEYRDFAKINWDGLLGNLSEFDSGFYFNTSDIDTKCFLISKLFNDLFSNVTRMMTE